MDADASNIAFDLGQLRRVKLREGNPPRTSHWGESARELAAITIIRILAATDGTGAWSIIAFREDGYDDEWPVERAYPMD